MFYLEFGDIDDFAKHLKCHAVDEVFVFVDVPVDLVDTNFRDAIFTARINDYIALCTEAYDRKGKNSEGKRAYQQLKERLTILGIAVKHGRWTGVPPSVLANEKEI
jgi:hypothetical protein